MIQLRLAPSPDLYHRYHRDDAWVIVVDILRASSTMVTALAHQAEGIYPVATIEECREMGHAQGYLMAAERQVKRCDFADLGNDPSEYTPNRIAGRRIVMTTTNGTRSIEVARSLGAKQLFIGAMLNLPAMARLIIQDQPHEVIVLAAGWQGEMSMEDTLYAGMLAEAVASELPIKLDDGTRMMRDLFRSQAYSLEQRLAYLKRSEHFARLERAGLASSLPYCLQAEGIDLVAQLDNSGWIRPRLNAHTF